MASTGTAFGQSLSLPEGGDLDGGYDAVIGQDGLTGTATLSIPLPTTRARAMSLDLALSYSSSAGNGEFGLGFALSTPSIIAMTNKGVPRYDGTDRYAMAGIGPLTPMLDPGTSSPLLRLETDESGTTWQVAVFLPCQQATLPLIEQWTQTATGISHWRMVTARGAQSVFGASSLGRVADPADPARTFQWLVEETTDTYGNRVVFRYKAEDGESVRNEIYEKERVITAQRYVERILYGNYIADSPNSEDFAFEVVFDYGEYDLDVARPGSDPYVPVRPWAERADPFSTYIAGFEIRTYRLCRTALMFHHFPAELGQPCLVQATRLGYLDDPSGSKLTSATCTGYGRKADGSYQTASLPPLELSYSEFGPPPAPRFRKLEVSGGPAAPGYLVQGSFLPVDLDGEGLPGFLLGIGDTGWYYPPQGNGRYGAALPMPSVPDAAALADPRVSVTDLDGNGGLQLLVRTAGAMGYFARTAGSWSQFTPLRGCATSYGAPRGELADLDGDGRSELLFVRSGELVFYPSLGTSGFAPARAASRQQGFPAAANSSPTELVSFADAFGDTLTHRIRVTDGEVAVWPSLGHGRFAPAVRLAGAPRLPRDLDTGRIYLADIDRSGAADLIFARPRQLEVYRNRSGNGFAPPFTVPLPFQLASTDQISFADVLGTGTTAIVVSRMAPVVEHWFCDLCETAGMPDQVAGATATRPNLLTGAANNIGSTCTARYASATQFLLADKQAGRPWLTRLPAGLQVIAQSTTLDSVSQTESSTTYTYHDGYFDPLFRQFQGFGLVQEKTWQTAPGTPASTSTKVWYHTGGWTQSAESLARRRSEYFHGDPDAYQMPDSVLAPAVLAAGGDTARQAYRALAGRVLRTEVYAADPGTAQAAVVPFRVTDHNYTVRLVQAARPDGPGSFFVADREIIGYDYDQDAADPRTEHSIVLANTLADRDGAGEYLERIATVVYPRRTAAAPARDQVPEQRALRVVAQSGRYSRVTTGFRLTGLPLETRSLDVSGLAVPAGGYFSFSELDAAIDAALANEIPYGVPFTAGQVQSRPATWDRVYYWNADQSAALPLGQVAPAGLCHHGEQAAFSAAWRAEVYGGRASDADLLNAGFVPDDHGYWWQPGEVTTYYGPAEQGGFRLPLRRESYASYSGGNGPYVLVTAGYDTPYRLIQTERVGYADPGTPVGVTGIADYQSARLWELTDGNGVVQQALYDPLGAVLARSVFKPASQGRARVGDADLRDYQVHANATFGSVLTDPDRYLQGAAAFYFYDRLAWLKGRTPAAAIAITATQYLSDKPDPARTAQTAIGYGDGSGRLIQQRQQAEPAEPGGAPRWICADDAVYSVSGQLAAAYLPSYSAGPDFSPPPSAPPPRTISYDPLGREVEASEPKGYLIRTEYTPWEQRDYDEDDTVLDSPYYIEFMASYPPDPTPAQRAEKDALDKAAQFYDTPGIAVLDNARNPVRQVSDSLGNIAPDAFAAITQGSGITSRELWDELHAKGYLRTKPQPAPHTTVTGLFEPYTPGFTLRLDPPYEQFAAAATGLLRQACLTIQAGFDSLGRLTTAVDPRLYAGNVSAGGSLTSASYAYPMGQPDAALAASADAGPRRMLTDVTGSVVTGWDGRELRQDRSYDGLGRELTMTITAPDGAERTLEVISYGEHQENAAAANLIGRTYEVRDEAGTLTTSRYTISGLPAAAERRFAADYATAPDWSGNVPLDPQRYPTALSYDALGRVTERIVPDGSVITAGYHVSGRLAWLRGEQASSLVTYLADVSYTAAGNRLTTSFGNGAQQLAAYDDATLRLASLVTRAPGETEVQRVAYTYDPVGNVTLARDDGAALAFGPGQPDVPGDYRYDATYRLLHATGLQHPGIDADTYATGFKQTLFAGLDEAGLPVADLAATTLEPYTETYSYDDAGNLTWTQHAAASASFPRPAPVQPASNRLADTEYDGAGNPLTLLLADPVTLSWDGRGNLAAVSPQAADSVPAVTERTWFGYDCFGERARKVVESYTADGQLAQLTDERYVGPFADRRVITQEDPGGTPAGSALRVQDGNRLVAVVQAGQDSGWQVRYQVADLLGSIGVELAGDGTLLSYEGFFPHGSSSVIAAADVAAAEPKMLRYSGEEADDSTSLYYYGSRYRTPWLGRWLSADPGGPGDGLNLYSFVSGNPLTMIDTSGRVGEGVNKQPDQPPEQQGGSGQAQPGTTGPPAVQNVPPVTPPLDLARILAGLPPPGQGFGPPDLRDVQRFLLGTGTSTLYSIFNSPMHVFVLGPVELADRFLSTLGVQQRSRSGREARREELRVLGYSALEYMGAQPATFPESVQRIIRPRTQSVLTQEHPGVGVPMHRAVDWALRQPETYADYAGGYLGSFLATGLVFLLARRYMIRNLGPLAQRLTIPLPWIGGALGLLGRGADKDRVWEQYEQARNYLPPDLREQALQLETQTGIPRSLVWRAHLHQSGQKYQDYAIVGLVLAMAAGGIWAVFFRKGGSWPFHGTGGSWGSGGSGSGSGGGGSGGGSGLILPSDPEGRQQLLRRYLAKQDLYRKFYAQQASKQRNVSIIKYKPKPTAVTVVRPTPKELVSTTPRQKALVIQQPKPTELVVSKPKPTAVVTAIPKSNLPMVRPSNLPMVITPSSKALVAVTSKALMRNRTVAVVVIGTTFVSKTLPSFFKPDKK